MQVVIDHKNPKLPCIVYYITKNFILNETYPRYMHTTYTPRAQASVNTTRNLSVLEMCVSLRTSSRGRERTTSPAQGYWSATVGKCSVSLAVSHIVDGFSLLNLSNHFRSYPNSLDIIILKILIDDSRASQLHEYSYLMHLRRAYKSHPLM